MAELQKYDRAAAFEMLQKEHGEYATPEQINRELDSFEKANGLGAPVEQTAPVTGSAPPPLTAQDKSIAAQAENYALVPSTARETVNTITAPPVGSKSLPDVASAAWNNLSTAEKYAVGGGTAALGSLAVYGAKKLVDRFLISDKQAVPPIDRTRDIPMGDTKPPPPPPPPPPEGPKLSAVDQQILDRQAINKPVRDAYLKQISGSTPAAEVIVNPPPVNTPKKAWEPPTASLAIAQPVPVPTENEFLKRMEEKYGPLPSKTSTVAPELATTPEQQVKAIKETEAPASAPVKQPPAKAPPKPKMDMPEGWGKGMSWLTTVHGVDGARAFIDQYNDGKPFATHKEMDDKYREVTIRPKYSDIPKDIRKDRRIPLRTDLTAVPPPSLRPNEIGQGGGSLIRSLTDPLQLKQ
jgi:hypothetical protein